MGTKIHKILGYGVWCDEYQDLFAKLDDNTVNGEVNALLMSNKDRELKSDHLFLDMEKMVTKIGLRYPQTFLDCIQFCDFGDAKDGYVVIMPPSRITTWHRWDDAIDYYEANIEDLTTKIKIIDGSISGYDFIPLCVLLIAEKIGLNYKFLKPMTITWWG